MNASDIQMPGVVFRRNERLSRHLPLRTGGCCDAFVEVHDPASLADALTACRREDWAITVVGSGSRIVVRDGGVSGAVVRLGSGFARIERDGDAWDLGAAVPVPAAAAATAQAGFSGLEDLVTIPGSVGASLVLDREETGWPRIVESVRFLVRGRERVGTLLELYESGPRAIVLGVRVRLCSLEPERALEKLRARFGGARGRTSAVPPGSWVLPRKRVVLREVLGRALTSEVRLREVAIPESAPELLINLGGGTARDLALLHQSFVARVARECGVELQSKVSWIGRA